MSASNWVTHRLKPSRDFSRATAVSALEEGARGIRNLVKQLYDVGYFSWTLRSRLRFGQLSRAPLRLLRLEYRGDVAECEWMARPADEWDTDLPRSVGDRHATVQAIQDAIAVRDLLFSALPGVDTVLLRVFRQSIAGELELIITGTVSREEQAPRHVSSLAMRAKLLGLQFGIEDGILEPMRSEECAMSV